MGGLDCGDLAVAPELRLLLVECDKLGVYRHQVALLGQLLRAQGGEGRPLHPLHNVLVLGENVHRNRVPVLEFHERLGHLGGSETQNTGDFPLEVEPGGLLLRDRGDREVIEDIPATVQYSTVQYSTVL